MKWAFVCASAITRSARTPWELGGALREVWQDILQALLVNLGWVGTLTTDSANIVLSSHILWSDQGIRHGFDIHDISIEFEIRQKIAVLWF